MVTVAPIGAEVTRADNPALPHTPAEIAADVAACAEAGASVCHLHVREDDGSPSSRPELFEEAIALIGDRTPIVTMVSTGGAVWMSIEERITGLEARPDLAGVETGSMNFGEELFVTSPPDARRLIERATELGIGLEAEMFDVGHVSRRCACSSGASSRRRCARTSSSACPAGSTRRRRRWKRCSGRSRRTHTGRSRPSGVTSGGCSRWRSCGARAGSASASRTGSICGAACLRRRMRSSSPTPAQLVETLGRRVATIDRGARAARVPGQR